MLMAGDDDVHAAATSASGTPSSAALDVLKLAAPLSKEQLIEILTAACAASPRVRDLLYTASVASPASRRLMVRNIHYSTTDEKYVEHFRRFGRLDDAAIVRERSGRSKGFGFVTFADINAMQRCLDSPLHLDGRKLFVKVAADPFSEFVVDGLPVQGRCTRRKVFVRNLGPLCDAELLKTYFLRYGPIEDCSVVYGPSGVSKGFAFVTFLKQDSAVRAAAEPQQTLASRVIFVSMAKSSALPAAKPPTCAAPWRNNVFDAPDFTFQGDPAQLPGFALPPYAEDGFKLPLASSTTSSAASSDFVGGQHEEGAFTDLIDCCLNSLSNGAYSSQISEQHLPSWQASTDWSTAGENEASSHLPRRFTDYACGLKDTVF